MELWLNRSTIRRESTAGGWQLNNISIRGGWDYIYSSASYQDDGKIGKPSYISDYAERFLHSKSVYRVDGFKRSVPFTLRKPPVNFIITLNDDGEYISRPITPGLVLRSQYGPEAAAKLKKTQESILKDSEDVYLMNISQASTERKAEARPLLKKRGRRVLK